MEIMLKIPKVDHCSLSVIICLWVFVPYLRVPLVCIEFFFWVDFGHAGIEYGVGEKFGSSQKISAIYHS